MKTVKQPGGAPAFAGLSLERPCIMGVVNVTPDSFSDGGDFLATDAAIVHGRALVAAGAAIIDVGGESTRPGAAAISVDQEIERVVPVIEALAGDGACVSVDTRHATVMEAAVKAGAAIINDVQALESPGALAAAAALKVPVILMHMQGDPGTMQANPTYGDAPRDVCNYLVGRVEACVEAGIAPDAIAVDPGIGFGKNDDHNTAILARLDEIVGLGHPVVLGVSRKSMIGRLAGVAAAKDRLPGSLAAALYGVMRGAHILRVHDVAETAQALAIWQAIADADPHP